ncbi:MAG: hypothetical protein WBM14_15685 [Terracidiphilus sp.]|jgi:hypothetical protein
MKSHFGYFHLLLAFLLLGPIALRAQATGQGIMFGSWKLNLAKSDFGSGPKLMAMTVKVTSDTPALIQFTVEQTTESGFAVSYGFKGAADGKEYPLTGASSVYSYTEEPGVVHESQKDTDGTITRGDFTLSAKGNVGIWLYTITSPDGTVAKQKMVFERITD